MPREVAEARRERVMNLQAGIVGEKLDARVGRTMPVLLDGVSRESDWLLEGRLETQAPEIDGRVVINDAGEEPPAAGRFYMVEAKSRLDYDLVGRIVRPL